MNTIYIDKLSFFSLLEATHLKEEYSNIYYFDTTLRSQIIVRLFMKFKLLKNKPSFVKFCLEDIVGKNGESKWIQIVCDITEICKKIKDQHLSSNPIINSSQKFDRRKMLLFFEKMIARDLETPILCINAAKWHSMRSSNQEKIHFLLSNNIWFDYLSDYCKEQGLIVTKHGLFKKSGYFKNYFKGYFGRFKGTNSKIYLVLRLIKSLYTKVFRGWEKKDLVFSVSNYSNKPKVAAWYSGKTITFNFKNRSEFFWLINSDLSYNQVLIYFQRTDLIVTDEMFELLKGKGLSVIAFSKNSTNSKSVPVFHHSFSIKKFVKLVQPISSVLKLLSLRQFSRNLFYFKGILYFASKYLYWFDFFEKNNVKININPTDYIEANIPMQQAIEDAGGVSISYHWSNIEFVSIETSNCTNVFFSFGPFYKEIYSKNESVIDNFIISGYITDYAFKQAKEGAKKLRRRLLEQGVKFIICFFDENSGDDVNSIITNMKSAYTYKYFINKILEDETLGLIFKPSFPKTIYKRISPISDLIEEAKATGRCVFVDKGRYVTEQYPTEVAQAADLSVGLLLSGAVSLESYLSGTPTVFLDLEKLYSKPIYQWSKGKVVFDSLDALFLAIQRYRKSPDNIPGFGDLSRWVEDKDPYRDGNASKRIGQYINWLLKKLSEGKTREEAISYANKHYKLRWGEKSISSV